MWFRKGRDRYEAFLFDPCHQVVQDPCFVGSTADNTHGPPVAEEHPKQLSATCHRQVLQLTSPINSVMSKHETSHNMMTCQVSMRVHSDGPPKTWRNSWTRVQWCSCGKGITNFPSNASSSPPSSVPSSVTSRSAVMSLSDIDRSCWVQKIMISNINNLIIFI